MSRQTRKRGWTGRGRWRLNQEGSEGKPVRILITEGVRAWFLGRFCMEKRRFPLYFIYCGQAGVWITLVSEGGSAYIAITPLVRLH